MATSAADIVKGVHKTLRVKVKQGENAEFVWNNLLQNKKKLAEYAEAMHTLATSSWQEPGKQCRVKWCTEIILNYFQNGGIKRFSGKLEKKRLFDLFKANGIEESDDCRMEIEETVSHYKTPWKSSVEDKLLLLDVGSCYNPFSKFEKFIVIPIDISPATEDVFYYDFLHATFTNKNNLDSCGNEAVRLSDPKISRGKIIQNRLVNLLLHNNLPSKTFDVIVFSLLLSYFPVPEQRLRCCVHAHRTLKLFGLLLIITPDSNHQNRHSAMMRSWKEALEAGGFVKYKYEKLAHLHCMAFGKTREDVDYIKLETDYKKFMYIPQDFQDNTETKKAGNVDRELSFDTKVFQDLDFM